MTRGKVLGLALAATIHVAELPTRDGWDRPYEYRSWNLGDHGLASDAANEYLIRSRGSDGVWDVDDPSAHFISY